MNGSCRMVASDRERIHSDTLLPAEKFGSPLWRVGDLECTTVQEHVGCDALSLLCFSIASSRLEPVRQRTEQVKFHRAFLGNSFAKTPKRHKYSFLR